MLEPPAIVEYFTQATPALLDLVCDLVLRDTPSGDAAASRAFATHYRRLLEDSGLSCREFESPAGIHVVGDWPGEASSPHREPHVTFVVHSDTVWPRGESARRPPEHRGDRLYGPGVYDMRAGLALVVAFFRFLRDATEGCDRRFRVFVSADEERGSLEARGFLKQVVSPGTIGLVPEPPAADGGIKVRRKGGAIYDIALRGRAAHAGTEPEKGASAVDAMARLILDLGELRNPARGITVNVGKVYGGSASNVVAEEARLAVDVRFLSAEDGETLDRTIRQLRSRDERVTVSVGGGIVFSPMVPDERTLPLIDRAVAIAREIGLPIGTASSGGGSDGSILSALNVPTLDGLGVDGGGAHSLDEHIRIDRLALRAALLSRLALEL